ncbi:MAG: osmotically inducible lipoprotein OsmB, partial [Comamonas sp.]
MKKANTYIAATVLAATFVLTGCANNQQLGTGVGAVAGGVIGDAVIGGTLGT